MNNKAKQLSLQKTNYANSHGLVNSANKSCAYDLAILCEYAMKNKKFRKVVSCKFYQTKISYLVKRISSPSPSRRSSKNIAKLDKIEKDEEMEEGVEIDLDSNEDDEELNQ